MRMFQILKLEILTYFRQRNFKKISGVKGGLFLGIWCILYILLYVASLLDGFKTVFPVAWVILSGIMGLQVWNPQIGNVVREGNLTVLKTYPGKIQWFIRVKFLKFKMDELLLYFIGGGVVILSLVTALGDVIWGVISYIAGWLSFIIGMKLRSFVSLKSIARGTSNFPLERMIFTTGMVVVSFAGGTVFFLKIQNKIKGFSGMMIREIREWVFQEDACLNPGRTLLILVTEILILMILHGMEGYAIDQTMEKTCIVSVVPMKDDAERRETGREAGKIGRKVFAGRIKDPVLKKDLRMLRNKGILRREIFVSLVQTIAILAALILMRLFAFQTMTDQRIIIFLMLIIFNLMIPMRMVSEVFCIGEERQYILFYILSGYTPGKILRQRMSFWSMLMAGYNAFMILLTVLIMKSSFLDGTGALMLSVAFSSLEISIGMLSHSYMTSFENELNIPNKKYMLIGMFSFFFGTYIVMMALGLLNMIFSNILFYAGIGILGVAVLVNSRISRMFLRREECFCGEYSASL